MPKLIISISSMQFDIFVFDDNFSRKKKEKKNCDGCLQRQDRNNCFKLQTEQQFVSKKKKTKEKKIGRGRHVIPR
ncbi:hypothetical protein PUN28_018838 [Cardiocondyla obscurior]|uniref:Uncharacterized protein n=1 Tax=Cardiocondyla obscurior TaxID=286306 RepID=A0AAW2ECA9_9HYME